MRAIIFCLALLLILITAEVLAGWRCILEGNIRAPKPRSPERIAATSDISGYARPEDDTFLSYPEWYIVWSYQEKADFQEHHLPSTFPYFDALKQYWSSYCCICRLINGKYPSNLGEQVMLVVIGVSFSAEYLIKGGYEGTIGRLSEWTSASDFTQEDRFAYKVAREYADFVHVRPFYEFHFAKQVPDLWADTDLWGNRPVRKWERKLFLTADYTIEAFYCWVIERLTHLTYGHEPGDTYAWVDNASPALLASMPRLKIVKQVGAKSLIVEIPRYHEFTAIASDLAHRGIKFTEIAGNSQIAVSVVVPQLWSYAGPDAQQLFSLPVLTSPEKKRLVLSVDVPSLYVLLGTLQKSGVAVEHIYDY